MAIIEVSKIEYQKDIRWRVTFRSNVLGIFTQEESANRFVNSHLCEQLIEHLVYEEESKKHKQISYCTDSQLAGGTD